MQKLSKVGVVAGSMLIAMIGFAPAKAEAGAVISSPGGTVRLGVHDEGHLNFSDGTSPANASAWGVAYLFPDESYNDATAPGCLCEGWGVSTSFDGGHSGFANVSTDGGANNLTVDSFVFTASTATSSVHLTSLPDLAVTQAYSPAPEAPEALFQDIVTITNNSATDTYTDIRYRRAMDWDIPPNEFNEFVTIGGLPATQVIFVGNNGFGSADPLNTSAAFFEPYDDIGPGAGCGTNVNFTDCGPADHGALWDFGFGDLAPGESAEFTILYGAAANETAAFNALGEAGGEIFSLGQASSLSFGGTVQNDAPTYIFAFKGVGGEALPDPTPDQPLPGTSPEIPEPSTLIMVGLGAGLAYLGRRKAKAQKS